MSKLVTLAGGLQVGIDEIDVKLPPYLTDLFGRLKTSLPFQQISAATWSSARNLLVSSGQVSGSNGTATQSTTAPIIDLTVASSASLVRARSKVPATYQPGKPLLQFITAVLGTWATDTEQRLGYGFGGNRLYFGQDATGLYVAKQTTVTGSTVTTKIYQTDWNVDPLDGTGVSEYDLDVTKSQIFFITFEYLGVGDVVFGVVRDREPIVCHVLAHPNTINTTYLATPVGFAFWENQRLSTQSGSHTLKAICASVQIEGSADDIGTQFPIRTTPGTTLSLGTANNYRPVMLIRLRSGWQNTRVKIISVDLQVSNGIYRLAICRNPTITNAATPSWTTKINSSVEYFINTGVLTQSVSDVADTAIWEVSGSVSNNRASPNTTAIGSLDFIGTDYADESDVFVIAIASDTGNAIVNSLIVMLEQQV